MENTNETALSGGEPEQETAAVPADAPEVERERHRLMDERSRIVAEEQLRQIARLDGDVATMEDLLAMPEYESFYGLVKKGVSLVDAYKLTRYDRLMERAAEAAARQTRRSMASRGYLTAAAAQPGSGDYSAVPADVAAGFRLAKPGISEKEIRRRYRQYQKYKRQ